MRFLNRFEEIVGALCMGVMVTVAFINVLTRYLLKFSFAFTEELTIYLFVWATLMGASIAFRQGSHIVVSVIYNRFSLRTRKTLDIFNAAISVIFFTALVYYSTLEVLDEMLLGVQTEAVALPVWWFTIAMPVSSLFIIYRIITQTLSRLRSSSV